MTDISIINIDPPRWQEAKSLRLEALQHDPEAFISSYEQEQQFSDEVWLSRVISGFERQTNMTLYAEVDGKLIGMLGANWSDRPKIQHVANIYSVYVTPSMRGKSVGSKLLESLLEELDNMPPIEKVKLTVTSSQTPAQTLYQKFGFEIIGIAQKEVKIGNIYYDEIYMEKFL